MTILKLPREKLLQVGQHPRIRCPHPAKLICQGVGQHSRMVGQHGTESTISKGKHSSQVYRNAYMLLNCDEGKYGEKITNKEICRVLKVSMRMIDRVKKRFVEEGFESCIERKPASRTRERKADGELEARLIALSCSKPPKGHGKWTLRLLADKLVELNYVDSICHETVRKVLKKTS